MKSKKKTAIWFIGLILGLVMLVAVSGCSKQALAKEIEGKIILANKYLTEQKYEEAILAFQEVIKIDPKNIPARIGLAKAYVATEKFEKAEASLKEVISIDEKNVQGYTDLIKLYETIKKDKTAIISLLKTAFEKTGDQSFKQWLEQYSSNESEESIESPDNGSHEAGYIANVLLFDPEEIKKEYQERETANYRNGSSYLDTKTGIFYTFSLYTPTDLEQGLKLSNGWVLTEKDIWKTIIVKHKTGVIYNDKTKLPENIPQEQSSELAKMLEKQGGLVLIDDSWYGLISEDLPFEEHLKQAEVSPDSYLIVN